MNLLSQIKEIDAYCQYILNVKWAKRFCIGLEPDWLIILDKAQRKSPGNALVETRSSKEENQSISWHVSVAKAINQFGNYKFHDNIFVHYSKNNMKILLILKCIR